MIEKSGIRVAKPLFLWYNDYVYGNMPNNNRLESELMAKVDVGGQAVIEGVMMKNKDIYAVAVRKHDKEIILEKKSFKSYTQRNKILSLPIIRGMVVFIESLVVGMKTLTFSASFFEVEGEQEQSNFEKKMEDKLGKKKMDDLLIAFSVLLAVIFSVGIFVLLPLALSQWLKPVVHSARMVNFIDGIIRVVLLLAYISIISLMKDIQRVFQYHGAEHKSIHCLESGLDLTVENVKIQSRLHKRCGTNFLLIVVLVSLFVLTFFNVNTFLLRLAVRLLLLPVIAGLSYEIIKLLGKNDNKLADIVSFPGLCLQKITTRDPDDEQIEVAIAALKGVIEEDVPDDDTKTA